MNILKGCYSELESIARLLPNVNSNDKKELFHDIYITQKMTKIQEHQWKEIMGIRMSIDNQTFLYNLLITCHTKNRLNILLTNLDLKNTKLSKNTFRTEDYISKNSLISHICLSNIWTRRRNILSDDGLIYLLSEFTLIECLSRQRQLFIQLSGTHETFFSLPYYITRNDEGKKRAELRTNKLNTRKRTIQFHLHATKQGQQAHLTDLYEISITRNMMHYHVSKNEQFDIYHPVEKSFDGKTLIDAIFSSDFSKTFINNRPKQEVVCWNLRCLRDIYQRWSRETF
jgi:hypothetical protein